MAVRIMRSQESSIKENFGKVMKSIQGESPCNNIKFQKSELLQSGTGLGYCKVGQLILQSWTGCIITKWDKFITKRDGYYKVERFYYKVGLHTWLLESEVQIYSILFKYFS